jgi:hypothetical protein
MKKSLLALVCGVALAGCTGTVEKAETNPLPHDTIAGPGLFSGESGNILDAFRSKNTEGGVLGVNTYLWRASLEAISFMPILQADSNGGVILTDWYSNPDKPNERAKVSLYILGKTLSAQGLKATVFKQTRAAGGAWSEAVPAEDTARALEDTILTSARALRVADKATK